MGSHEEHFYEWLSITQNLGDSVSSDLQLAMQFGKALLDRNKELETTLRHYLATIDEKNQEVVHLQKQSVALREINDSRFKTCEQLEVRVQNLESINHTLNIKNFHYKKRMTGLIQENESLENRCEELTLKLDEARNVITVERQKYEKLLEKVNTVERAPRPRTAKLGSKLAAEEDDLINMVDVNKEGYDPNTTNPEDCNYIFESNSVAKVTTESTFNNYLQTDPLPMNEMPPRDSGEIIRLLSDLATANRDLLSEKQRVCELEDQLFAMASENKSLQAQVNSNLNLNASVGEKSVHEEFSVLEEVRQGNMCCRCLRSCDDISLFRKEGLPIANTEINKDYIPLPNEVNESSNEKIHSETAFHASRMEIPPHRPPTSPASLSHTTLKDLVQKYESIMKSHQEPSAGMATNTKDNLKVSTHEEAPPVHSDKIKNDKEIQTDNSFLSFLCSINTAEDCKFNIYGSSDPSLIDSRLNKRPRSFQLFKEIYAILKKNSENFMEWENDSVLDDPILLNDELAPSNDKKHLTPTSAHTDNCKVSEKSIKLSESYINANRKNLIKKNRSQWVSLPELRTTTMPSREHDSQYTQTVSPGKYEPLKYVKLGVGIRKSNKQKAQSLCNVMLASKITNVEGHLNEHIRDSNHQRAIHEDATSMDDISMGSLSPQCSCL